MASKKYNVLFMVFMLLATATYAQTGSGYDVYDSSVISSKNMPQQNEFWNNAYSFPAKPRNMWEIGVGVGVPMVFGDVTAKIPTIGFEAHVRKAFGYVFSLRLQYLYANAKGMNWRASENFGKNPAWDQYASPEFNYTTGTLEYRYGNGGPLAPNADVVYYNYKAKVQDIGLQGSP
jgi:hypothetical protein